ncbi:MAG TPA: hypothetical protein VKV74_12695 [Bryobacteraceae bacterium]|nr:hypothetical protein [Bryobacteraceae bacterium]
MRSLKLVWLAGLAATPALFANVCVPDTLADYIALGAQGCSVGSFNVEDFGFSILLSTRHLSSSDILVTPVESGDSVALIFDSPTKQLKVGIDSTIDILISYFWDPGTIRSAGQVMNDPVTAPGLAELTVNGCENSNFINGVCPTTGFTSVLAIDDSTKTTVASTEVFTTLVTTLGIEDEIDIEGRQCHPPPGSNTCADIVNFENVLETTPEPSTWILGLIPAGGGIWMGLRRRRGHSR